MKTENLFKAIFDHAADAIHYYELGGKFIEANRAACRMLGYKKSELLQMRPEDISVSKASRLETHLQTIREKGYAIWQSKHVRKDGTLLDVEVKATLLEGRARPILLAIVRDISEQKKVEERLEESEERHRSFIENIPIGIYRVTPGEKGRFLMANPAFVSMFGYQTEEEVKKIHVSDIYMYPQERKLFSDTVLGIGSVYMTDRRLKKKDGTPLWATVTARVVPGKKGDEFSFFFDCAVVDITERKKSEEERRRLEIQFQQAQRMEAIGTLAGGIAHDFNNLLMGIHGNASLMLFDLDPKHPHFDKLKNIQDYVENGAHLTRQLLGFARGGKYEVKPTQLNDLILKSSEMFGRTKKEITIHRELQKELHVVDLDRGQIEQVLLNLYVNAWQAMPEGGELFLRTKNILLGGQDVALYAIREGPYVCLSVTDTGVGMDEAVQQRIFEPFYTTKDMGRGTGLGLASAYGIIKNHGGKIEVCSALGKGATFHIYLPASEKQGASEEEKRDQEILRGKETVLFVDDEAMILDVGKEILGTLGYRVITASGGQEAVEICKNAADGIDMVILDLIMPGLSARETLQELKRFNPRLKVLLSSGYSADGQAVKTMDMGCHGFIQKPFTVKELSRKIREVLGRP
jgi:two-component system cell cycle sensor histidine kinase/response regulator CckA